MHSVPEGDAVDVNRTIIVSFMNLNFLEELLVKMNYSLTGGNCSTTSPRDLQIALCGVGKCHITYSIFRDAEWRE